LCTNPIHFPKEIRGREGGREGGRLEEVSTKDRSIGRSWREWEG